MVREEIADRLRGLAASAFLATSVDDRPHVAPVWYLFEDRKGGVVSFFTQGQKLANLRRNPKVALAIEGPAAAWLVVIRGTARVVEDRDRRLAVADELFGTYVDDDSAYRDAEGNPQGALVEVRVGSATLVEN